jgi:hypothetical protein
VTADVPRIVTFTSDYGTDDEFVGVCHAVIARIVPEVRIIDIAHGVRGLRAVSAVLRQSLPFTSRAVHLAVVDPGVGTDRRGVVIGTGDGSVLVGPDNGLLLEAADALGGPALAFELLEPRFRLEPTSATFHGRDIFAPAAAHLAIGRSLGDLGPAVDPVSLERLDLPGAMVAPGAVGARVTATDGFGNVQLNATEVDLQAAGVAGRVLVVNGRRLPRAGTFAELPEREPGLIIDSDGHLAIVVNRGNAAVMLGLAAGDAVVVEGS